MAAISRQGARHQGARSVLDFVSHLQKSFESGFEVSPVLPDPSSYLRAFPLSQIEVSHNRVALDRKGTELWNLCRKLGCTKMEPEQQYLAQIRALAFFMIDSAQARNHKVVSGKWCLRAYVNLADGSSGGLRLVRTGLVGAKFCLRSKQHELASQLLERVALYVESPRRSSSDQPTDDHDFSQAYLEYLCLRMALSWQQNRLELAEHFFVRMDVEQVTRTPSVVEDIVDLFLEMGKSQLDKGSCDMACVWLGRAFELLENQDLERLSPSAGELRLDLFHSYARALYSMKSSETYLKSKRIVEDYGNKLVVRLLQLEIISREEKPNSESYHAALNAISTMIHLTEQNLSIVLHFSHQLRQNSTELACDVLKCFLFQRLVPHGNEEWITKTFITLLWMSTTGPLQHLNPSQLEDLFSQFYTGWGKCLCPEATIGALVLLWKRIEDNFARGRFQNTIAWCKLAQHKLLENAGKTNADKIERKLVQCYLEIPDLDVCKVHVSRLLSSDPNPLNHYLAYCLALKMKDTESARQAVIALNGVTNTTSEDLLYACVSRALESDTAEQTANVLLIILKNNGTNPPKNINLLQLLRYTIRAHLSQLSGEEEAGQPVIDRILGLFAAFPAALQRQPFSRRERSDPGPISVSREDLILAEIDWFLTTCYNLAVKVASAWPALAVVNLFELAIQVLNQAGRLNIELKNESFVEHHARECLCHFAITGIWVSEGRRCTDHGSQAGNYCKALSAAAKFEAAYNTVREHAAKVDGDQMNTRHTETLLDLKSKRQVLLPLEFEAAMYQHLTGHGLMTSMNHDDLSTIISKAQDLLAPHKTYALIADIVLSNTQPDPQPDPHARNNRHDADLSSSLPLPIAATLLIQIITAARTLPDYDTGRASRWIRCLAQLCLDHQQRRRQVHLTPSGVSSGNHQVFEEEEEDADQPLIILEEIILQALTLASQNVEERTEGGIDDRDLPYPAEELEWLAATLFNLGIDFYVAGHRSRAQEVSKPGSATATATATGGEEKPTFVCRDGDGDGDKEAKKWIVLAVRIADILGKYPPGQRKEGTGGDRGLLSALLRRKVREGLGWQEGWEGKGFDIQ